MGLLTNPNTGDSNKLSKLLEKYTGKLGVLSYVVGIVWLVFLANAQYNLGTYFSENALLPGLVVENFYEGHKAEQYYNEMTTIEEASGQLSPTDFTQLFKRIGFQEVEEQNFTVLDPVSGAETPGSNIYAILRAKRAAGTESLIFNVPYFPKNSKQRKNTAGVALMLAVAEYFANQVYWAKDIVFLVADGHVGSLAWIKGHQEIADSNPYLRHEHVRNKAGNIQAAVNFVVESPRICHLSTKFHGINGQLPNLDLVNLVNKFVVADHEKRPNWEADFWKLVNYMKTQATGSTTGSHGYFLKYGVESVTLYGARGGKSCRHYYSFSDVGRYLEATFRSLNNLLERLHQSFFFYLKTTPNRFISIGLYFPPLALIIFPILLRGASVWVTRQDLQISKALCIMISIHILAVATRWAIPLVVSTIEGKLYSDYPLETLKLVYIIGNAIQFVTTAAVIRPADELYCIVLEACRCPIKSEPTSRASHNFRLISFPSGGPADESLLQSLYCFTLLQISTAFYCLALFNPSLIIIVGIVVTPMFTLLFFFQPAQRRYLFYPLLTVAVGALSYYYQSVDNILPKYFYESELYGNFLFDFISLSLLPSCYVLLSLL